MAQTQRDAIRNDVIMESSKGLQLREITKCSGLRASKKGNNIHRAVIHIKGPSSCPTAGMKSPRKGHCLANLPPIIIIKLEGAFDKTRNLPAFLWIFVYKSTIDSKIECDSLGNRL